MNPKPSFEEEIHLWNSGKTYVAGIDEVGRGAFAGPVVAAAVILPQIFPSMDEINDSKLLLPKHRQALSTVIKTHALSFSIAEVSVEEINMHGIGKATAQAFSLAVSNLAIPPDFVLVDAFSVPGFPQDKQKGIIKGDQKSISIAAASIIAKVYRDELMEGFEAKYAHYKFAINKGYGTKAHREAISQFGLCEIHRTSFSLTKYTTV